MWGHNSAGNESAGRVPRGTLQAGGPGQERNGGSNGWDQAELSSYREPCGVTGSTICPRSGERPVPSVLLPAAPAPAQTRGSRERCTYICPWAQSKQTGRPAQNPGESGRSAAGSKGWEGGKGDPGFWAGHRADPHRQARRQEL